MLCVGYLNQATIYGKLNLYDKAIQGYLKSLEFTDTTNYIAQGTNHYNLAINYLAQNDVEKAYLNLKRADEYFTRGEDIRGKLAVTLASANFQLDNESYSSARFYLYKALSLSQEYGALQAELTANHALSLCYHKIERLDSAFYFIEEAIALSDSFGLSEYKVECIRHKALLAETAGDIVTAARLFKLIMSLQDSITLDNEVGLNQVMAEHNQELKGQQSHYQNYIQRKNIAIRLSVLLIVFISLGMLWLYRKNNHLSTAKQREKRERDYLNRKLVSQSANLATQNETLIETLKILRDMKQRGVPDDLEQNFKQAHRKLQEQQEVNTSWKDFFMHFEEVHPNLLTKWRSQYGLSKTELKICAFLKMNLSYKEIAQILNIKPESVKISVYRIKKRLSIKKDDGVFDFL